MPLEYTHSKQSPPTEYNVILGGNKMDVKIICAVSVIGTILTALAYFLGGWDIAVYKLLILIVVDYITGVLRAIYDRELNSGVGRKGIIKKIGFA